MFVRFTTESATQAKNWGFQNAIIATAQANSGFTPSTPSGCIDYTVLSNVEAGGWISVTDDADPLTGDNDSNGNFSIKSEMTSKDLGIEVMAKTMKWIFDQTNGDWDAIRAGVIIPDPAGTAGSNTNPSEVVLASDLDSVSPHPTEWYASITKEYCYIWEREAGFQSMIGYADLDGVPPAYKSQSNYWAPVMAMHSTNGTNYPSANFRYLMNGIFTSYRSSYSKLEAGNWMDSNAENTSSFTLYDATPEVTFYTYDNTSTPTNSVYHKSIDTNGDFTDSLNPIALFNPMNNMPYMPMKGIKALGRFSGSNQSDVTNAATNYQLYRDRIVYDENGDRYMIIHFNPWAPVAIRCM
jgi:hypothetical protein